MKKLACKDMDPSTDCAFEARGTTAEEVAEKMMKHVKSDHADKLAGMTFGEMKKMMLMAVHE